MRSCTDNPGSAMMIGRRGYHRMMLPHMVGIACLALVMLGGLATATPARANELCGMYINQTTRGVRAYINRFNPPISAGGMSACWVMVYNPSKSAFAQVGWVENGLWGPSPYYFYEYEVASENGPKMLSKVPSPVDMTAYDLFDVTLPLGGGLFNYWINGVNVMTTSNTTWTPTRNEYCGEILYSDDYLAGMDSYHEYFHDTEYYTNASTGVWTTNHTDNCIQFSDSSHFDSYFPVGAAKFWIWDIRNTN